MADETKVETPPPSTIDTAALAKALGASITDSVKAAFKDVIDTSPQPPPQPAQPVSEDLLGKTLAPYIQPAVQKMSLDSQNALDYAKFYSGSPEARKHESAVEAKFEELMRSGMPLKREDIFRWYRGLNFDKFREEATQAEAEAQQRAQQAATVGGGLRPSSGSPAITDPWAVSPDDLANALKGVAF